MNRAYLGIVRKRFSTSNGEYCAKDLSIHSFVTLNLNKASSAMGKEAWMKRSALASTEHETFLWLLSPSPCQCYITCFPKTYTMAGLYLQQDKVMVYIKIEHQISINISFTKAPNNQYFNHTGLKSHCYCRAEQGFLNVTRSTLNAFYFAFVCSN